MRYSILVGSLVLILCTGSAGAAAPESTHFQLQSLEVSSGGGRFSSVSYQLYGTVGQPAPLGTTSSGSYTLISGFWHELSLLVAEGDVNGDGAVTLQDAILALKILSNIQSIGGRKEADVNDDGHVGVEEVIFILQKVGTMR